MLTPARRMPIIGCLCLVMRVNSFKMVISPFAQFQNGTRLLRDIDHRSSILAVPMIWRPLSSF